MKRAKQIVFALLIVIPATFLLFLRFAVAPSEGYPTWEAVRNMLIRDGEIVITVPDDIEILSVTCDDPDSKVEINGQVITTKIGYSWCIISVDIEIQEQKSTLQFKTSKLNNWNRLRFDPVNPKDPYSEFTKTENGVEKVNSDTIHIKTAS